MPSTALSTTHEAAELESLSAPDPFACQTPTGKVFWLRATRRRPGCRHSDHARALVRQDPDAEQARIEVWIFSEPGTDVGKRHELADQVRRALVRPGPRCRWRAETEGWIVRRIEHVWSSAGGKIVDAEELVLALLDAYPIVDRSEPL